MERLYSLPRSTESEGGRFLLLTCVGMFNHVWMAMLEDPPLILKNQSDSKRILNQREIQNAFTLLWHCVALLL